MEWIQALDWAILQYVHSFASPFLNKLAVSVSWLGKFPIYAIFILPLLAKEKTRELGLRSATALIILTVLNHTIIKTLFGRLRPFMQDPSIELIVKAPVSPSFPSGHSAIAFAFAFLLLFSKADWRLKVLGMVLAILMGWSRIYLQVHFPSDVAGGMLLGLIWGYSFAKTPNPIKK